MEVGSLEAIPLNHGVEMVCIMIWSYPVGGKNDDKAFIFTLKNPHGVEPTRYMKRGECQEAIQCNDDCGPIFGNFDIFVSYVCNEGDSCSIDNDGAHGYECHPEHKKSLFVNTAETPNKNYFSVLDYEVYTHDKSSCNTM